MDDITLGELAAWAIGGSSLLAAILYLRAKLIKPIVNMLADWNGTEERPGVPRRPGVMERLNAIEDKVDTVTLKVADHAILDMRISTLETTLETTTLEATKKHESLMLEIIKMQNVLLKEGGASGIRQDTQGAT